MSSQVLSLFIMMSRAHISVTLQYQYVNALQYLIKTKIVYIMCIRHTVDITKIFVRHQ